MKARDPRFKEFLSRWQLALTNANTDDWRMVVNTYSLLKNQQFDFPEEIETIFASSRETDLATFERAQQRRVTKMAELICSHLEKMEKSRLSTQFQ